MFRKGLGRGAKSLTKAGAVVDVVGSLGSPGNEALPERGPLFFLVRETNGRKMDCATARYGRGIPRAGGLPCRQVRVVLPGS